MARTVAGPPLCDRLLSAIADDLGVEDVRLTRHDLAALAGFLLVIVAVAFALAFA